MKCHNAIDQIVEMGYCQLFFSMSLSSCDTVVGSCQLLLSALSALLLPCRDITSHHILVTLLQNLFVFVLKTISVRNQVFHVCVFKRQRLHGLWDDMPP